MSLSYEKLEGNMAELTITVPAEDFKQALVEVYNKNKGKFKLDGFRNGHVPMAMIEKMYGPAVFYEDAANNLINKTYPEELENCDLDIVSSPEIGVTQIEKGKDFIYTAKVATKPEVKLGDIASLEVEVEDVVVTDEDVDAEIKRNLKQNARKEDITDAPAAMDDEATIDFEGFVDDVAFEGGKGEDYPLVLGSGSFIPGFEDQIVGHNIGDEFDVNVTFPEEYQAEDLAGKAAVFKCKLKAIKRSIYPELDDEFVGDTTDFDTVDEYKADVRAKLEERKTNAAKNMKQEKAVELLAGASEMDIPEPMIETRQRQMIDEFAQQLMYQGMNMENYYQMTGLTHEQLMEQVRPEAERRIKNSLVIEAVAKEQNFEVSQEEIDAEIEKMAKQYSMEVDKIKEIMGDKGAESITEDLRMQKAVEYIADNVKEIKK